MIDYDAMEKLMTPEEQTLARACGKRAGRKMWKAIRGCKSAQEGARSMEIMLSVCHCFAESLDFKRLLAADDFNFYHDVCGISRHLSHKNGKLLYHFLPRFYKPGGCAAKSAKAAEQRAVKSAKIGEVEQVAVSAKVPQAPSCLPADAHNAGGDASAPSKKGE